MSDAESLHDPKFAQAVSLRDAYRVMETFLVNYHERGETKTGELLAYLGELPSGSTGDPAALRDFLDAAKRTDQSG